MQSECCVCAFCEPRLYRLTHIECEIEWFIKCEKKKKNLVGAKTQILNSLTHFSPPLMLPSYKEEGDAS